MLDDLYFLFIFLFFLKSHPTLIEEVDNPDDELLIIVQSKLEIMPFRLSKYESWIISSFSKPHTSITFPIKNWSRGSQNWNRGIQNRNSGRHCNNNNKIVIIKIEIVIIKIKIGIMEFFHSVVYCLNGIFLTKHIVYLIYDNSSWYTTIHTKVFLKK